jgi:hypothetical protein
MDSKNRQHKSIVIVPSLTVALLISTALFSMQSQKYLWTTDKYYHSVRV